MQIYIMIAFKIRMFSYFIYTKYYKWNQLQFIYLLTQIKCYNYFFFYGLLIDCFSSIIIPYHFIIFKYLFIL